jgi:NADP-dependent 3-hydroxy acid dehydrogenase YdfG
MSGIEGKVVAITGASSGIGEATALLLAERGAKVVLGARGSERLKALADRIVSAGGEVAYARTDVKRREDLWNGEPARLIALGFTKGDRAALSAIATGLAAFIAAK